MDWIPLTCHAAVFCGVPRSHSAGPFTCRLVLTHAWADGVVMLCCCLLFLCAFRRAGFELKLEREFELKLKLKFKFT